MTYKTWRKIGRVRVSRDARGRFKTRHRVRAHRGRKAVTAGRSVARRDIVTRRRIPRRPVAKRRVRRAVARRHLIPEALLHPIEFDKYVAVYGPAYVDGRRELRRYEISGSGRSVYEAVKIAVKHPPKTRFLRVRAEDFVNFPHAFIGRGYWIGKEVESE